MRKFKVPGQTDVKPQAGLSTGERRRLIAMVVGALLIFGAFLYSNLKSSDYVDPELDDLPVSVQMQETVLLPEIDAARIDELVADDDQLDRVVIETEALDVLLEDARRLTPRHFRELAARELDAELGSTVVTNPSAHRGQAFYARGLVDSLRTRQRGDDTEFVGRLLLDDGSYCYFLVLDAPESGGYVRVDGLFLEVYSDEDDALPGNWIDGPLLVGPRAVRSYRPLGEVTALRAGMYDDVEDARFLDANGNLLPEEERRIVEETPFEPLWHLMAYARDLPADAIDWDAAPELDAAVMQALMEDPEAWRLQPLRIPISRVQDGRVLRVGENPARIEEITQGWMGNWGWPNVIKFQYPGAKHDIQLRDFAFGKGFFLHDFAYPSAGRGMRVAPVVVLTELERFVEEPDPLWAKLGAVFGGLTILLLIGFFVLLRRDSKRSKELQENLVRRRRARRARQDRSTATGSSGA